MSTDARGQAGRGDHPPSLRSVLSRAVLQSFQNAHRELRRATSNGSPLGWNEKPLMELRTIYERVPDDMKPFLYMITCCERGV